MLFGKRQKFQLNNPEATYKVHYLGNVMTSLVKGGYQHGKKSITSLFDNSNVLTDELLESHRFRKNVTESVDPAVTPAVDHSHLTDSNLNKKFNNMVCNVDKPVKILWDNHLKHNGQAGLKMKLTLTQGGLRVNTKDHGLTEYYGHRIHFLQAHPSHPKLFIWVYQHVGKNLKSEIRCHAVLCERAREAKMIEKLLTMRLHQTFLEYKREKRRLQNSRLCNSKNGGLLAGQVGTKKRTFTKSTKNYKPPVQHGMCSAPKLDDVMEEEEEEFQESAIDDVNTGNSWAPSGSMIKEEEEFTEDHELEEEVEDDESEEEIKSTSETDFSYQNIIADLKKNGYENVELDAECVEKIYQENGLKLPLSSSSSSLSISSSTELQTTATNRADNDDEHEMAQNNHDQEQQQPISSDSPIFISSCSTASSISSSASEPTVSPCSLNQLEFPADTTNELLSKHLANDSGVCTNSTSSVLDEKLVKCMSTLSTDQNNNHIDFNQVSYEFLSDLSQQTLKPLLVNTQNTNSSRFRGKFTIQSRSFNMKNSVLKKAVNVKNQEDEPLSDEYNKNVNGNSFYNPFNRSAISKSFSAFTSRLKQQQLLVQKHQDGIDSVKSTSKTIKLNELIVDIASKEDQLETPVEKKKVRPAVKLSHTKKMAPLPPPMLSSSTSSFVKCYPESRRESKLQQAELFYPSSPSLGGVNNSSDQAPKVVRLIKKGGSSHSSNSPLSSPELSSWCSESSSYSTHSTLNANKNNKQSLLKSDENNVDNSAQLIISL